MTDHLFTLTRQADGVLVKQAEAGATPTGRSRQTIEAEITASAKRANPNVSEAEAVARYLETPAGMAAYHAYTTAPAVAITADQGTLYQAVAQPGGNSLEAFGRQKIEARAQARYPHLTAGQALATYITDDPEGRQWYSDYTTCVTADRRAAGRR